MQIASGDKLPLTDIRDVNYQSKKPEPIYIDENAKSCLLHI